MSHAFENSPANSFPAHYGLPEDQLTAEMAFRDEYTAQFPDYAYLLNSNIQQLQRQAGIVIPKYKINGEDREQADAAGLTDDLNFVGFGAGPVSPNGSRTLMIGKRVHVSSEELEGMSIDDQQVVAVSRDGTRVVDMPEPTRAMVDGIYALTGATVIRDERLEGLQKGGVIRKGTYMDVPVYFSEDYDDALPWAGNRPAFSLRILGSSLGEVSAKAMNLAQLKEFVRESGLPAHKTHLFIENNNVTKDNYKSIIGVLKAAKEAVDSTAIVDDAGDTTES